MDWSLILQIVGHIAGDGGIAHIATDHHLIERHRLFGDIIAGIGIGNLTQGGSIGQHVLVTAIHL